MKLCKIDEQGYFVEDVIVDEIPKIVKPVEDGSLDGILIDDPLYIYTTPVGLHRPKWNFDTEEWVEGLSQAEIDTKKPSDEQLYQDKVKELIGESYSIEQEIGLTNDCNMSLMAGGPIPQAYIDYRNFVELCKDKAHMEVFGIERA